jgi:hypothetical protein
MRLTKSQLKQIIKEELALVLEKGLGQGTVPSGEFYKKQEIVLEEEEEELEEEAKSKSQQQFFALVRKCQKNSKDCPSDEIRAAAKSMPGKETKKFASTSHQGLPQKV